MDTQYKINFGNAEITANTAVTVTHTATTPQDGVEIHTFDIDLSKAQKDADSYVQLKVCDPMARGKYRWHPFSQTNKSQYTTWQSEAKFQSSLAFDAPVAALFDNGDKNVCTYALGEVKRNVQIICGYEERVADYEFIAKIALNQFGTARKYSLTLRTDRRRVPLAEALDGVRLWWDEICGTEPMHLPPEAKMPMYSTWYSYHQDITAAAIESECRLAAKMGMKAVIVDDGWQTDDSSGGYAYTGDWEVTPTRISDMKAHVAAVHALGMKYILWFSVPFVGHKSRNWARFSDKILCDDARQHAGILDPRYPEVRDFLINKYKSFAVEYGIDGFKLDFIDRFHTDNEPPYADGMDIECVCDAVQTLMTAVKDALTAINPDIMIEFRQHYTGAVIRSFGNMLRVADCPYNTLQNRVGIADIRMISRGAAVHSDMIVWSPDESAEDAAWHLLNSLFGVVQYSVKIAELSDEHRKMSEFWLKFMSDNRKVLLDSGFAPHDAQSNYPIIEAFDDSEKIVAVYESGKVIRTENYTRVSIANATDSEKVYVECDGDFDAKVTVYDCTGNARVKDMHLKCGVNVIEVKRSGLAVIER